MANEQFYRPTTCALCCCIWSPLGFFGLKKIKKKRESVLLDEHLISHPQRYIQKIGSQAEKIQVF